MEKQYRNIPDPIYSANTGEGEIVRNTLTQYIHDIMPDHLT